MRGFFRKNLLLLLFLVLLSLLFILWGRMLVAELYANFDAFAWSVATGGFK